jgi:hypothetical protein
MLNCQANLARSIAARRAGRAASQPETGLGAGELAWKHCKAVEDIRARSPSSHSVPPVFLLFHRIIGQNIRLVPLIVSGAYGPPGRCDLWTSGIAPGLLVDGLPGSVSIEHAERRLSAVSDLASGFSRREDDRSTARLPDEQRTSRRQRLRLQAVDSSVRAGGVAGIAETVSHFTDGWAG